MINHDRIISSRVLWKTMYYTWNQIKFGKTIGCWLISQLCSSHARNIEVYRTAIINPFIELEVSNRGWNDFQVLNKISELNYNLANNQMLMIQFGCNLTIKKKMWSVTLMTKTSSSSTFKVNIILNLRSIQFLEINDRKITMRYLLLSMITE